MVLTGGVRFGLVLEAAMVAEPWLAKKRHWQQRRWRQSLDGRNFDSKMMVDADSRIAIGQK